MGAAASRAQAEKAALQPDHKAGTGLPPSLSATLKWVPASSGLSEAIFRPKLRPEQSSKLGIAASKAQVEKAALHSALQSAHTLSLASLRSCAAWQEKQH